VCVVDRRQLTLDSLGLWTTQRTFSGSTCAPSAFPHMAASRAPTAFPSMPLRSKHLLLTPASAPTAADVLPTALAAAAAGGAAAACTATTLAL
jgi:hypothetical protein